VNLHLLALTTLSHCKFVLLHITAPDCASLNEKIYIIMYALIWYKKSKRVNSYVLQWFNFGCMRGLFWEMLSTCKFLFFFPWVETVATWDLWKARHKSTRK